MTNTPHDDEELREQTRRSIARLISIQRGDDQWNEDDYTTAGNILIVCHRLIRARDEQREREVLDKLMETAREYHEKYPDAGYFDFAGLVARMRITSPNQQTGEK